MHKYPQGEGGHSFVPQAKRDGCQDKQEKKGVGECPSHVRAAKNQQAQGLVYDIGKHGPQCQEKQIQTIAEAGGGQGQAHMGEEEHWMKVGSEGIKRF